MYRNMYYLQILYFIMYHNYKTVRNKRVPLNNRYYMYCDIFCIVTHEYKACYVYAIGTTAFEVWHQKQFINCLCRSLLASYIHDTYIDDKMYLLVKYVCLLMFSNWMVTNCNLVLRLEYSTRTWLTHRGQDKITAISQVKFKKCIFLNENVWFSLQVSPLPWTLALAATLLTMQDKWVVIFPWEGI